MLNSKQIEAAREAFYAAGWGQNEVMWKCWQQGMAFAEAEALKECEARIHQLENEYNYLKDQIERWKQPCEADARDAARYRWLRNADNWDENGPSPCVATCESTIYGDELDSAIDAALAEQGKKDA